MKGIMVRTDRLCAEIYSLLRLPPGENILPPPRKQGLSTKDAPRLQKPTYLATYVLYAHFSVPLPRARQSPSVYLGNHPTRQNQGWQNLCSPDSRSKPQRQSSASRANASAHLILPAGSSARHPSPSGFRGRYRTTGVCRHRSRSSVPPWLDGAWLHGFHNWCGAGIDLPVVVAEERPRRVPSRDRRS